MSDTDPIVQAVAEALEVHQVEFIDWQVGWDCGCNEHGYLPGMPALTDALRHQAEVAVTAARPLIEREAKAAALRDAADAYKAMLREHYASPDAGHNPCIVDAGLSYVVGDLRYRIEREGQA